MEPDKYYATIGNDFALKSLYLLHDLDIITQTEQGDELKVMQQLQLKSDDHIRLIVVWHNVRQGVVPWHGI